MEFKLFIILQLCCVLCWNEIQVLSADHESENVVKNAEDKEDIYSSSCPNDIYDNVDLDTTDFNDTTAIVDHLNVDNIFQDALEISWTVTGLNATMFLIKWFTNDELVNSTKACFVVEPTGRKFNYKITNLDACVEYKIVVTPLVEGSSESKHLLAKTLKTQPGAPLILTADPCNLNGILALNISWKRPKVGGFCVNKYAISVETKIHDKRHFLAKNTSDTNVLMTHLYACTSYTVMVKAVDLADAYGLSATIQSKPTPRKVTEKPRLISGQSLPPFTTDTTSITFHWYVFDEKNNCTIESIVTECQYSRSNGYGYELKDGKTNRTIDGASEQKVKLVVNDLSPYTLYICDGSIVNEAGTSDASSAVWVLTKEDAPSPPQSLKLVNESTFTWEPPAYMPGHLQQYRITFTWLPRYAMPDFCAATRRHVQDNLHSNAYTWSDGDAFSDYKVDVDAYTKGGWSRNSASISFQSLARGVPDRVTKLECDTKPRSNDSNVLQTTLSWNLPCSLRGRLRHFEVFVFGTKNHLANHTMRHTIGVPGDYDKNARFGVVLGELRPQHFYAFRVSARIHEAEASGEVAVYQIAYPAGIPPVPNKADMDVITLTPNEMPRTTTSVEVLLPLFNSTNGDVKFYAIIVSRLGFKYERERRRFKLEDENAWPNVSSWKEAYEKDFEISYQVTEPRWTPYPHYIVNYGSVKAVKYVIGEDVTCHALTIDSRLYCNGPLKPDTTYQVWMRAFTNDGYADSDYVLVITDKKMSVYLVIGVIIGILMLGVVAAVLLTKMSHYKGVKNPHLDEESDLERYRDRRQPNINSNPRGHHESASAPARTRRRIDQPN